VHLNLTAVFINDLIIHSFIHSFPLLNNNNKNNSESFKAHGCGWRVNWDRVFDPIMCMHGACERRNYQILKLCILKSYSWTVIQYKTNSVRNTNRGIVVRFLAGKDIVINAKRFGPSDRFWDPSTLISLDNKFLLTLCFWGNSSHFLPYFEALSTSITIKTQNWLRFVRNPQTFIIYLRNM